MIQSVHKAVVILELLADHYPETVCLSDICLKTGINKSTCVHILNTLAEDDLVNRSEYGHYTLSTGCFYITRFGKYDREKIRICRPVMEWFRKKSGETVLIAKIHSGKKYIIDHLIGEFHLKSKGQNIILDDIYRTASGRMGMAYLSEEHLWTVIQRNGLPKSPDWNDFKNIKELKLELDLIKKSPWCKTVNEGPISCVIGYATPLFKGEEFYGALATAIDASATFTISDEREKEVTTLLVKSAVEINRRLSF